MTLGLLRPGIYLRPARGRAYFFRSRNSNELIEALGAWRGEPITTAIPERRDEAGSERAGDGTSGSRSRSAPQVPARTTPSGSAPPAPLATEASRKVTHKPSVQAEPDPSSVEESLDDIDYDSIGLTDAEMEELLGETRRDDDRA